jgi:hypothetical protein
MKNFYKINFLTFFLAVALLSFSSCVTSPNAVLEQNPQIIIANNTGKTVIFVQVSESDNDSWEENKLPPDQSIENGGTFALRLPFPLEEVNFYDMRLVDVNGDTYTIMNIEIPLESENNSSAFTIEFTEANFDTTNNAAFRGPPITIQNNTIVNALLLFSLSRGISMFMMV